MPCRKSHMWRAYMDYMVPYMGYLVPWYGNYHMMWDLWNTEGRTCSFHAWQHVWIETCDIQKDAHVTFIYGTIYELELVKYGTTQMSFPYMTPCMKWNWWTMEGRTSNFIHSTMYEMELLLRFCRTGFTGSFSKHCKIRRRADLFDFHPRFLKCRDRGVSVRDRPWMIAYSYSGWTTNTKTSLTVHKSHTTQICHRFLQFQPLTATKGLIC